MELPEVMKIETRSPIKNLAYSPDGTKLAISWDHSSFIQIRHALTEASLFILDGHRDSVGYLTFSPSEPILASCCHSGEIRFWNTDTGQEINQLRINIGTGRCLNLAYSPNGERLASLLQIGDAGRIVKIYDPKNASLLLEFQALQYIWHLAYNVDGTQIALNGDVWSNQPLSIYNSETGALITHVQEHRGLNGSIKFSNNGKWLIASGTNATISCYSTNNYRLYFRIPSHPDLGEVYGMDISPDSQYIAVGDDLGRIIIWNIETQLLIKNWVACGSAVYILSFSPDSHRLAAAGNDGNIRVWRMGPPGQQVKSSIKK